MDPHRAADQLADLLTRADAQERHSLEAMGRSEAAMADATELLHEARSAIAQSQNRRRLMPKTIRELREARGQSRSDLAAAFCVRVSRQGLALDQARSIRRRMKSSTSAPITGTMKLPTFQSTFV